VQPGAHSFGDVGLGGSATKTFQLRNGGNSSLWVSGMFLVGGNASEFSIESGAAPFSLVPGEARDVRVTFRPAIPGPKSARIDVTSDDPDESPLSVTLSGRAVPAVPAIAVAPKAHDFGAVLVGASTVRSFRVGNEGAGNLQVSGVLVAGADAADFHPGSGAAPFTLEPGQFRDVSVRFRPGTGGAKSAELRLSTNDPDAAVTGMPLSGRAVVAVADGATDPDPHGRGNARESGSAPGRGDPGAGAAAAERSSPASYDLAPNRPNPFRGATTIRVELAAPGTVDLSVYDAAGRRVATLLEGARAAGSHEAVWNGVALTGRRAPSGVYFARLRAGSFTKTIKMVLAE
jgi:hypothetical protein